MPSETARVEAFSDGVFAIAITLLILEIKPPPVGADLSEALVHEWPSFLAFLTSFASIGVMWVNHHRLFTLIHRVDQTLIALNLLLLLGVTWIPFPTAVLAEHLHESDARIAALLYSISFFVIAIVFNVLWRYASHHGRLLARDAAEKHVLSITKQYSFGPLMYASIAVVGWFNATACLVASLILALYFAIPANAYPWRRLPPSQHERA